MNGSSQSDDRKPVGRPPNPQGRLHRIDVRISEETLDFLCTRAIRKGKSLGAIIRGILNKHKARTQTR